MGYSMNPRRGTRTGQTQRDCCTRFPVDSEPAEFIAETEAVASDYRDRRGYNPAFLGEQFAVDLPTVDRNVDDVLDFEFDSALETELRYEHFSVVRAVAAACAS